MPRPSSSYRELPPPPALAPYVSCLWTQTIWAGDGTYEHPVLPDGCSDIVSINGGLAVVGEDERGDGVYQLHFQQLDNGHLRQQQPPRIPSAQVDLLQVLIEAPLRKQILLRRQFLRQQRHL